MPIKKRIRIFLDQFGLRYVVRDLWRRVKYRINFKLQNQNKRFLKNGTPDGLPLPHPLLVHLVTGGCNLQYFYETGKIGAECIKTSLLKNGLNISSFEKILDFGCGCGRILRHWKSVDGPRWFGCDMNPKLAIWCKEFLSFANIQLTPGAPPLNYPDHSFDFIYSISVFTHIVAPLQIPWLLELKRILKPRGYALITVAGMAALKKIYPEGEAALSSKGLCIIGEKYPGTNICGAFHSEKYIREDFGTIMKIVDVIPEGAKDASQDIVILQKA